MFFNFPILCRNKLKGLDGQTKLHSVLVENGFTNINFSLRTN